jgi:hypothetical protein
MSFSNRPPAPAGFSLAFPTSRAWAVPLIFGLMGLFFWAIRGTGGYGGLGGALLAGLGWGVLWYLCSGLDGTAHLRPYGRLRVIAALVFGIGIGGMTGYGAFIGWIQGHFYLEFPDNFVPISPWTGYLALFVCGLHWGGIAGAFLAWCAPREPLSVAAWCARIGAGIAGAATAYLLVDNYPQGFLPLYDQGVYEINDRAVGTVRNIAPHLGMFLGFLVFEIIRRDWRAVAVMAIVSGGFALSFTVGGYFHTFHGTEASVDWWKAWEMSIGLGGGAALGLVFLLFNVPETGPAHDDPSRKERFFGGAFPIWFVTADVLGNAWDGVAELRGYETMPGVVQLLYFACLAASAAYFAFWLRDDEDLPLWVPAIVLALVTVCGYAVTIPPESNPVSTTLMLAYSLSVSAGVALFFVVLWPLRD